MKTSTKVAIGVVGTGAVIGSLPVIGAAACAVGYSASMAAFNAVVGAAVVTPVVGAVGAAKIASMAVKASSALERPSSLNGSFDYGYLDWMELVMEAEDIYDVEINETVAEALRDQLAGQDPTAADIYEAFLAM